jgi:hypothetical protein
MVIIIFVFINFNSTLAQTKKPSSYLFEFGPAFKSDYNENFGLNIGFSQFSKKCWLIDYIAVFNKTGFYSNTISPKLGMYHKVEDIILSLTTGFSLTLYNTTANAPDEPFFGIPLHARVDILANSLIGLGFKGAYIFSLKKNNDDQATVTFFLSINLNLK